MPKPRNTPPAPHDALEDRFARGRITRAQFRAAREFQRHHALAVKKSGDDASAALKSLRRVFIELGLDGAAILQDALIRGMNAKEIAASRGHTEAAWARYYAKRVSGCLDTLAELYGFTERHETTSRTEAVAP
jgi:hypothetical protein